METKNTTDPLAPEKSSAQENLKSMAKKFGKSLLQKAGEAAEKTVSTGLESAAEDIKQNGVKTLGAAISKGAGVGMDKLKATAGNVGQDLLQGKNIKSIAWGLFKQTPAFRIASLAALALCLLVVLIIVLIIVL